MDQSFWDRIALAAAVMLPLWNGPLIARIIKRRSSDDISLSWVLGVWVCFLAMLPAALQSEDLIWRLFNVLNVLCFTAVVITVLLFRRTSRDS